MFSSIGGFIGIFLGYSLFQVPDLWLDGWHHYRPKAINAFRVVAKHFRTSAFTVSPNAISVREYKGKMSLSNVGYAEKGNYDLENTPTIREMAGSASKLNSNNSILRNIDDGITHQIPDQLSQLLEVTINENNKQMEETKKQMDALSKDVSMLLKNMSMKNEKYFKRN